jgi:transcriptional regulator with XRE-family HTH domain
MQNKPMESRLERVRAIFAANLKRCMQERNLSQSDLARAIWKEERTDSRGYPQPVNKDRISAWVNGRVLPTQENLQKAAEALGVTPEALLPELGVGAQAPNPELSQQHYVPAGLRPDLTFRMVDGGVYAEIRCKVSLAGWRELMTVLAKYITEYEDLRAAYGLSDADKNSGSLPMHVRVDNPGA